MELGWVTGIEFQRGKDKNKKQTNKQTGRSGRKFLKKEVWRLGRWAMDEHGWK